MPKNSPEDRPLRDVTEPREPEIEQEREEEFEEEGAIGQEGRARRREGEEPSEEPRRQEEFVEGE